MQRFNPANHIKIAADSRDTLRRCDVYRVINSCPDGKAASAMAKHILAARPELADEIGDCLHECGFIRQRRNATEFIADGPRTCL